MNLEFVNHASIIYNHECVSLMCDPWMEGAVFQNGWNHLAPTKFEYADFERITHIWFSHEHPDHFFPPNIKKINQKHRQSITVFYQKTNDKKVVNFINGLGFKEVIELDHFVWFEILPDFKIMCSPFDDDSWLCVRTKDKTILNTNDCVIRELDAATRIKKKIGKVDILLTQFSYGKFEGNKDEPEKRRNAVKAKFDQMNVQIAAFKPTYLIPFASFVYFCHEENYYMNNEINRIETVYNYYNEKQTVKPVVMYCGSVWEVKKEYTQSKEAIDKWNMRYEKLMNAPELLKSKTIPLNEIIEAGEARINALLANVHIAKRLQILPELIIHLTDLDTIISLSNSRIMELKTANPAILLSSEVLLYCLKVDWGFNTTRVNGRVQFKEFGHNNFVQWQRLFDSLNHNHKAPSIIKRVINKVKSLLKS